MIDEDDNQVLFASGQQRISLFSSSSDIHCTRGTCWSPMPTIVLSHSHSPSAHEPSPSHSRPVPLLLDCVFEVRPPNRVLYTTSIRSDNDKSIPIPQIEQWTRPFLPRFPARRSQQEHVGVVNPPAYPAT